MNDAEWFYNIYEQYSKNLYRYLHTLLKGRGRPEAVSEIEDCIQETFIVLWNKRETLQAHPKLDAWLYKTSSNILNNKLSLANTRSRHTAFSLNEMSEHGVEVIDRFIVSRQSEQEYTQDLLEQVKDSIGDDTFEFLIHYYDRQYPIETLKKQYAISTSGIKMRVKRALNKIRKEI